jgi:hypothetical protein
MINGIFLFLFLIVAVFMASLGDHAIPWVLPIVFVTMIVFMCVFALALRRKR